MPELPEVETVKNTLKKQIIGRIINKCKVIYPNIIETPSVTVFTKNIKGEKINDVKRRGKWLLFELDNYYLLSHLRMEGKYYLRNKGEDLKKHDHVIFILDNDVELRYNDTRKFGRMHLIKKEDAFNKPPLNELGKEPWDSDLTIPYLKDKYNNKKLPIKTVLLDQSIIVGIGNIYADEILFLSKINPLKKACDLTNKEMEKIIINTKDVLDSAIKKGGTTIRSYESSEGVHGNFQNNLFVHNKEDEECIVCKSKISKIKVGSRGTYYCPKCQK